MSRYDSDGNLCVSVQAGTTGTGGAGLTQTEHDALLAVATAVAQATQITHEAAIRAAVEALAAALVSGRLRVDPSGVVSPISATALPLPAGATTEATLQAVRDRLPAALASGRLAVETTQASGAVSTMKLPPLVQDVVSIAGLAAGVTTGGAALDLGATRCTAQVIVMKSAGVQQTDTVFMEQSDDGTNWIQVPRADGSIGNALGWANANGTNCIAVGRPSARWVRGRITCLSGGSAQPGGALLITAVHPGI